MISEFRLHPDDVLTDLPAPVIDDGGLPIAVSLLQFLEQAAGKPELGERGLELVIVLEFFALLRSHVSLKEDFAGIVGLRCDPDGRDGKAKTGEQNQPDFFHDLEKPEITHVCG